MTIKVELVGHTLIKTIKHDNLVFVYDSNLAGHNNKGSALIAKRFFGAEDGKSEGLMVGGCYALPTKDKNLQALPIEAIQASLVKLFNIANRTKELNFMLTRLGCEQEGVDEKAILHALSTLSIPSNVMLCGRWQQALGFDDSVKVIVAGGREFDDYQLLTHKLDTLLANIDKPIEIICGGATGADAMGKQYAISKNQARISVTVMNANWDRFKKPAGMLRNSAMAWYGTHLVAFWDKQSRGTKDMITTAKNESLATRIVHYEKLKQPKVMS